MVQEPSRRQLYMVSLFLWGGITVMGLIILAAVGLPVASGQDADTASANATAATEAAESHAESHWGIPVNLDFDPGTGDVSFSASLPNIGVSIGPVGPQTEEVDAGMTHDAIDEGVEESSSAGLCAAGLDGEDSPVSMSVDGENNTVNTSLSRGTDSIAQRNEAFNATQIVQECRTNTGEYRDGDA